MPILLWNNHSFTSCKTTSIRLLPQRKGNPKINSWFRLRKYKLTKLSFQQIQLSVECWFSRCWNFLGTWPKSKILFKAKIWIILELYYLYSSPPPFHHGRPLCDLLRFIQPYGFNKNISSWHILICSFVFIWYYILSFLSSILSKKSLA